MTTPTTDTTADTPTVVIDLAAVRAELDPRNIEFNITTGNLTKPCRNAVMTALDTYAEHTAADVYEALDFGAGVIPSACRIAADADLDLDALCALNTDQDLSHLTGNSLRECVADDLWYAWAGAIRDAITTVIGQDPCDPSSTLIKQP